MFQSIKRKCQDVNWFVVLFVVVLSYGFLLTNQSIGIDDENIDFYYKYNGIVAAGRWGSWLLYKIVNTYAYLPVWRETIAIIVLIAAAVLFLSVYEYVSQAVLDRFISTAGVCLIITFPLVTRMFAYIGNCVETSLCIFLATLSYFIYIFPAKHKVPQYLCILALQILGLALIEATAVYFCVEICLFGLVNKNEKRWSVLIFGPVFILALSIILSKLIGKLIAARLAGFGFTYADYALGWFMKWNEINSPADLLRSIQDLAANFRLYAGIHASHKFFLAACIIWIAVAIFKAIKKEFTPALFAFGIVVASFSLFIISANGNLPLRSYVSNFIAIVGIALYGYPILTKWTYKKHPYGTYLTWIILFFVLFHHTKETNEFYQLDYKRYIRDVDIARNVNYDLQKTTGTLKPDKAVVFVGTPDSYNDIFTENEFCLTSIFMDNVSGNSIRIHRFFSMLGYEYPTAIGKPIDTYNEYYSFLSNEYVKKALTESSSMPSYPAEGYIKNLDGFIVIKLGATG